jgi:hypothetical protein
MSHYCSNSGLLESYILIIEIRSVVTVAEWLDGRFWKSKSPAVVWYPNVLKYVYQVFKPKTVKQSFFYHSQPSCPQEVVLHSITARFCLGPYHFAIWLSFSNICHVKTTITAMYHGKWFAYMILPCPKWKGERT